METLLYLLAAAAFLFLMVLFVLKSIVTPYYQWKELKKQGIPFGPFKPLVGDLAEVKAGWLLPAPLKEPQLGAATVMPLVAERQQKYGDVFGLMMGPVPSLWLGDPELVRQVLVQTNTFGRSLLWHRNFDFLGSSLFTSEGAFWSRQRRLCNPAFRPAFLQLLLPKFHREAAASVERTHAALLRPSSSPGAVGEADMQAEFALLTMDVMCRASFGSSLSDAEVRQLGRASGQLALALTERFMRGGLLLPFYTWFPTPENIRILRLCHKQQSFARRMVAERRQLLEKEPSLASHPRDLLGFLLQARDDATNAQMTDRQLMDECLLFLGAGSDTTSRLLSWTFLLLALHPEWQQRLREEVSKAVQAAAQQAGAAASAKAPVEASAALLQWEHLEALSSMACVLWEALRVLPAAPFLAKAANHDCQLGPYKLKQGTDIYCSVLMMNYSERIWGPDVNEFRPERFAGDAKDPSKLAFTFIPFGAGPRVCIGQNFSLLEAKTVLSHYLLAFSWELSPGYQHHPFAAPFVMCKWGLPLRMTPLQS